MTTTPGRHLLSLLHASNNNYPFLYHHQAAMIHGWVWSVQIDGFPLPLRALKANVTGDGSAGFPLYPSPL